MKIGLSTYSMVNRIEDGSMTVTDVMDFAKKIGSEHIELVPFGFTLYDDKLTYTFNDKLIWEIKEKSDTIKLPISNYAVLGDLLKPDNDAREAEIRRLSRHIDVAAKLGISLMRHDISSFRRPLDSNTPIEFERWFPVMVEACRRLADYASEYNITTLVENHGFFVNGSDRIIRLIEEVDRSNFRMLVDTGNFACVDEDCAVATEKSMPFAVMVHLKDFYIRKKDRLPGIGGMFRCDSGSWFSSNSGLYMLRGSILAQGDIEMRYIFNSIANSGFNGYASVEFEGMEDNAVGSEAGIAAAKSLYYNRSDYYA